MRNKIKNTLVSVKDQVNNKKMWVSGIVLSILSTPIYASASDGSAEWNTIMNYVLTWIPRIGGVVMFIGAIEFALAFKTEDAEGKTKGMRTVVAGAMVIGIAVSLRAIITI